MILGDEQSTLYIHMQQKRRGYSHHEFRITGKGLKKKELYTLRGINRQILQGRFT